MKKDNQNLLIVGVVLFTIAIIFFFVSSRFNKKAEIQNNIDETETNAVEDTDLVMENSTSETNIDNFIDNKLPNRSHNLNPVVEYSDIKVNDTAALQRMRPNGL